MMVEKNAKKKTRAIDIDRFAEIVFNLLSYFVLNVLIYL